VDGLSVGVAPDEIFALLGAGPPRVPVLRLDGEWMIGKICKEDTRESE